MNVNLGVVWSPATLCRDVRYGSKADIEMQMIDVRFTPDNGIVS
jgi:hypothetical protein